MNTNTVPIRFSYQRPSRFLDTFLLAATMAPPILAVICFGGVYSWIWGWLEVGLTLAVTVVLWSRALRQGFFWDWLLLPALAFAGLVFWQWFSGYSIYPGATLTGILQLALYGMVFYLALQCFRARGNLPILGWTVWLLVGLLAMEGIAQYFTMPVRIYWFLSKPYANPFGPYVNRDDYAGCMDLLLPLATVVALRRSPAAASPGEQWLHWIRRGIFPLLGVISVVVSQARGGVLTLLFEAIAAIVIFHPARAERLRWLVAAAGAGSFLLLANWAPLFERLAMLGHHNISALDRLLLIRSSWLIFRHFPWLGTGFNTWATIYPAYQVFDNGKIFLYAHNEYVQLLAETGLVGFSIMLWFLVQYLIRIASIFHKPYGSHSYTRHLQKAAFLGTAGLMLHSLIEFQFHIPGNGMLFFLLAGAATAHLAPPAAAIAGAELGREDHAPSRLHSVRMQPMDKA